MAHITVVVATRNTNLDGEVMSEETLLSLARQLEEKYGNGTVHRHNDKLKVAVDGPQCICGKRDCYGPEHAAWCPLWNSVVVEMEAEIEEENEG